MQPTQNRYSSAIPFTSEESPVSRQLYEFLKAHANYVWGSGVEIYDPKLDCVHPIHRNHKANLVEKFVFGHKVRPSVLTQKDIERHLDGSQKFYFTGSKSAQEVLVYLDVDCHEDWQDDADDAVALLRAYLPNLYVCDSPRGRNGYLLLRRVNRSGFLTMARHVNHHLNLIELALRKLFLCHGIKSAIEVKGHIQHRDGASYYCGKLAKLPNFKGMTIQQMEALRNTSRLTVPVIRTFAQWVDARTGISDEAARSYYGNLRKFKDEPPPFLGGDWTPPVVATPSERPKTHAAQKSQTSLPGQLGSKQTSPVAPMYENGDSFSRGFQVCLALSHRLKRVPTTQEVLDYLRENSLFTGRWEENEQKRAGRIAYNLDYIRRNFDPAKLSCSTGGDLSAIDLFEYCTWADRHYPTGIETATAEEVTVFLAVTKFCLVTDPNHDGTLPYQRFKAIWELLYQSGKVKRQFRWERFVQMRTRLEQDDVVVISGEPSPGKAQKWRVGRSFPNYRKLYPESVDHPSSAASSSASGEEREGRESYLTLCLQRLTPYFHQIAFLASELVHHATFGFWRRE